MAEEYDYDLFVIGCGSGGMRATRFAKKHFNVAKVGTCDMPFSQLSVDGKYAALRSPLAFCWPSASP